MRIPSGVTDQYIYFVAVDSSDFTTRETGLTTFTVYRSRNGGAAAAMTTPTINETDTTNMPGVYELLLDEDMTIDSGDDSQEMAFHITQADMAPVTRVIELYRPKITAGNTLGVASDGDISGNLDGTVATVTDVTNGVTLAAGAVDDIWDETMSAHNGADSSGAHLLNILADTATTIPGTITTLQSSVDTIDGIVDNIILDTDVIDDATSGLVKIASDVAAILDDTGTNGVALLAATQASIDAIEGDTSELQTDDYPTTIAAVQAVVDAVQVTTDKFAFTVANQVDSNVLAISGDATAADNLEESCTAIVTGTVGAGSHTTAAIVASDVTDEGDSTFNGRLLVFTSGAACTYEAGVILTYTSSTGAMVFDSATWTTAPSENDTFVIL